MGTVSTIIDPSLGKENPGIRQNKKAQTLTKANEYAAFLEENSHMNNFRWVHKRKVLRLNEEVKKNFATFLPQNAMGPITEPKHGFQKDKESTFDSINKNETPKLKVAARII
jgi:hypothetical protein